MTRAVYTTRFYGGLLSNSIINVGPVPAGVIWVIRDITMLNEQGWPEPLNGGGVLDQHNFPLLWTSGAEAEPGHTYHWDGRQVLFETETLRVIAEDAAWAFRISGYVLTLP